MRFRPPKKDDQENIEKAYQILVEVAKKHPEIETSLWAGALMSALVNMHLNTGIPYKGFCKTLEDVKKVYKDWFED